MTALYFDPSERFRNSELLTTTPRQSDLSQQPNDQMDETGSSHTLVLAQKPELELQPHLKHTPLSLVARIKQRLLKLFIEATFADAHVTLETNAMYEQQGAYQERIVAPATIKIPNPFKIPCNSRTVQELKKFLLRALLKRENTLTQQLFAEFQKHLDQSLQTHPKNTLFLEHSTVSEAHYPSSGLICSTFEGEPTLCKIEGEDDNWLLYMVEGFAFRFTIENIKLNDIAITYTLDIIAEPEFKLENAKKGFQIGEFEDGIYTSKAPENYPIERFVFKEGRAIPELRNDTSYDIANCLNVESHS